MTKTMQVAASWYCKAFANCKRGVDGYHVRVTCVCGKVIHGHVDSGYTNCGGPCSECALEWWLVGDVVDHISKAHKRGLSAEALAPLLSFRIDDDDDDDEYVDDITFACLPQRLAKSQEA